MSFASLVAWQLMRHSERPSSCRLSGEGRFHMRPRRMMSSAAAAFVVVAVLAVMGWARKPAPGTPYNAGAGYVLDTNGAVVQANTRTVAPDTRPIYGERQTEPYREASAVNPCAETVGYGYATPSY